MLNFGHDRGQRRTALAGLGVAAALLVSGCEQLGAVNPNPPHPAGSYESAQFFANPSEVQTDMFFRPGSGHLAAGEASRIGRELRSLVLRPSDDIVVTLGGTGSEVLDARREATARHAVSGTPARIRIETRVGFPLAARERRDVGLIQVKRYSTIRVVCPNQGQDFIDDRFGRDELLMGCTNAVNIANMVADPRDLTAPGSLRGGDGVAEVGAVERYRADQVKQPGRLQVVGN